MYIPASSYYINTVIMSAAYLQLHSCPLSPKQINHQEVYCCAHQKRLYTPQRIISNLNWCNTANSVTLYFNMCFSRRDILFENCVTIMRFIRISRQHVECKLMKRPRIDLSICHGSREFLRPLFAYKKVEGH